MMDLLQKETPKEKLLRLSGTNQKAIPRIDIEQALGVNRSRLDILLKSIPSSGYEYKPQIRGGKNFKDIVFTEKGIESICVAAQQLEITNTQVKTILKEPILQEIRHHSFGIMKELYGITARDWIQIMATHNGLFKRLFPNQARSAYYIPDENVPSFLKEFQKIRSKRK